MSFNWRKVLKAIVISGALLYFTVWAWTPKHKTFYVDGNSVVMIDYNATEKDWKDAYLQWKAMKALDEYNAK
jgi:hypothetical protein